MTTDISIVRWDPTLQQEIVDDYEYDGGNSSSRLFERSRIKALAGTQTTLLRVDTARPLLDSGNLRGSKWAAIHLEIGYVYVL